MAAGKINLQANDGKILGLYAPDGMNANTDTVPASVNGDATKTFKVANAINADEALAKGQFNPLIHSVMDQIFYVDATNGNDTNDGSSAYPFKTIKKACDSVVVGGIADINLLAGQTYVLESDIYIYNKKIRFLKQGNGNNPIVTTNTRTQTYGSNTYAEVNNFRISGGAALNFHGDVDIVVPSNGTGNSISFVNNGFIVPTYDTYNGSFIGFHYCSITINGDFPLINNHNWNGGSPFTDIKFWGVGVNLMKAGTKVINYIGDSTCSIGWSAELKDSSGNYISVSGNLLSGIVKDANGVPRNIISNIVF